MSDTNTSQTRNKTTKDTTKKFGFFTVFVTIVGTVIGAGIFFKADNIYGTTGSTVLSLIAWVIAGIFILIMAASCIEIISSSKDTNESGTLSNWASKFVSPKFGTFVGLFLIFLYMPLTIIPLAQFTTDFIASATIGEAVFTNVWLNVGITFAIFLLITLINFHSASSSRGIQIIGTIVKAIPILLILFSSIIFIIINPTGDAGVVANDNVEGVSTGIGSMSSSQVFNNLMLALPAVLFAYDGFIYAGSLQNETKEKGTFKKALIAGIAFTAIVYTLLAFGLYGSGTPTLDAEGNPTGFSVSQVIIVVFGEKVGAWMNVIISITIVISIATGLNGFVMTANRSFKSLSETHLVRDDEMKLQKENTKGVPFASSKSIAFVNMIWFAIIYIITIPMSYSSGSFDEGAINVLSEFAVIIEFAVISVILIGGIRNRKTNRVKVEKNKWFIPTAVISILFSFFVVGYQIVYLLFINPDAYNLAVGLVIIISVLFLWIASGYQSRAMEERYNGQWENMCVYTNNVLLEKSSDYVDFDEILSTPAERKKLDKYIVDYNKTKVTGNQYTKFISKHFTSTGDYFYEKVSSLNRSISKKYKEIINNENKQKDSNKK